MQVDLRASLLKDLADLEISLAQDNEGHPGWTIGSVQGAFTDSKWMMPNLVLVNAGL
jgi:hypothetical protein